jgi:hypothetical protein
MRIDTVNIHFSGPVPPGLFDATGGRRFWPVPVTGDTAPPAIGQPWQGGIYAGVSRGEDGQPDAHLVLAPDEPSERLEWQAAIDWATTVRAGGHDDWQLPSRVESALLYANLRDQFDTSTWYWTRSQCSAGSAWTQDFNCGGQGTSDKSYEGRARAVRRLVL